MKTTIDIDDVLLMRAKNHAKSTGRPLRAVVEQGLRLALSAEMPDPRYRLADLSWGDSDVADPLEEYSWQDLRDLIYNDR